MDTAMTQRVFDGMAGSETARRWEGHVAQLLAGGAMAAAIAGARLVLLTAQARSAREAQPPTLRLGSQGRA